MNSVKLQGTKSIYKSLVALYVNNEPLEREIKKTIQFTIAWKTIKHLGTNLNKEVKDTYTENYKIFMKKIEKIQKMERYSMLISSILLCVFKTILEKNYYYGCTS